MKNHVQSDPEDDELLYIPRSVLETIESQTDTEREKNATLKRLVELLGLAGGLTLIFLLGLYAWSERQEGIEERKSSSERQALVDELVDANAVLARLEEVLGDNPILITQEQIEGFAVTVDCNNRQALQEAIDELARVQQIPPPQLHITDNCPTPGVDPLP